MEEFKEKVVIVTGASAGIGRCLALQLAKKGAKLSLAARRKERLQEVIRESGLPASHIIAVPTDVSDPEACKHLVDVTINTFGRLDLLINNAGLTVLSLFEDFPSLERFQYVMDVNFLGAVSCTYHALPYLKESQGQIVVISSAGGLAAIPYNSAYIASKHALHGFFDSLRMEVARYGIRVTLICPWWVVSEFHEAQLDKYGNPYGERGRAVYTKNMMSAESCAQIILKALSKQRQEVIMGPGRFLRFLRALSPELLNWITVKFFLQPLRKKMEAANRKY